MDNISSYSGSRASTVRSNENETSGNRSRSRLSRASRGIRSALSNTANSILGRPSRNNHRLPQAPSSNSNSNSNSSRSTSVASESTAVRSIQNATSIADTYSRGDLTRRYTLESYNRAAEAMSDRVASLSVGDESSTVSTRSNRDTESTRTSQDRASAAVTANDQFDESFRDVEFFAVNRIPRR